MLGTRYQLSEMLGVGTFGTVFLATKKGDKSEMLFAVKRLSLPWTGNTEAASLRTLPEVAMLIKCQGPNIIPLREVIQKGKHVYLVFPCYSMTLLAYANGEVEATCCKIRSLISQLASAISHIHSLGVIHRDVKPENIMISQYGLLKLADFGLAREHSTLSMMTTYVSTRWYRSPEILLKCNDYGLKIDVWALGLIAAELVCRAPLFPGNSDADMLHRISLSLSFDGWGGSKSFKPNTATTPLDTLILTTSSSKYHDHCYKLIEQGFIPLLHSALAVNPSHRVSASDFLKHPFFEEGELVLSS
eukprot:TRINITY_DN19353_c0_g1_i1.p1 TRINITY_DN19353_c0_g1~~TRINITY_DN19353_c0_g1_i1.p1  ORF type:complete len:303 (+),score=30.91 TRINITY_DN19353_c0_g1_i1:3-911(+)